MLLAQVTTGWQARVTALVLSGADWPLPETARRRYCALKPHAPVRWFYCWASAAAVANPTQLLPPLVEYSSTYPLS